MCFIPPNKQENELLFNPWEKIHLYIHRRCSSYVGVIYVVVIVKLEMYQKVKHQHGSK